MKDFVVQQLHPDAYQSTFSPSGSVYNHLTDFKSQSPTATNVGCYNLEMGTDHQVSMLEAPHYYEVNQQI